MKSTLVADEVSAKEAAIDVLQAEVATTVGVLNSAHARLVELAAEALADGLWEQWGIHTPEQWLVWQAGLSRAHARQVVAVARRVPELPHLDQAVHEGALSLDQAEVVARHCPPGFDADVVGVAVNATVPQLHRMLGRYQFTEPVPDTPADPTAPPARDPEPERKVTFGSTDDGSWHATLDLPADEGALYEQALVAKRDELFRRDHPGVDADSPEGRAARRDLSWADAAVALAADSLAVGDAAHVGSSDLFRVLVHLEADPTNPTGLGVAGLHLGAPLPAALRQMLLCDCEVVPVWETLGNPVAVGRAQRIVPRRVRRLIEHRDKGCRVPGCGQKRWLHIHHIVHWEDLGPTDPDNLICLCHRHHRLHHLGLLPITGTAGDLTVCDRHGRELQPVGHPRAIPATTEPAGAATDLGLDPVDYEHPTGERLHLKWIDFSPNITRPERQPVTSGSGSRSP